MNLIKQSPLTSDTKSVERGFYYNVYDYCQKVIIWFLFIFISTIDSEVIPYFTVISPFSRIYFNCFAPKIVNALSSIGTTFSYRRKLHSYTKIYPPPKKTVDIDSLLIIDDVVKLPKNFFNPLFWEETFFN